MPRSWRPSKGFKSPTGKIKPKVQTMVKKAYSIMIAIFILYPFLLSQKKVKIEDINNNGIDFKDEVIFVEGCRKIAQNKEKKYILIGDRKREIKIKTICDLPGSGSRFRIKGIVDIDPNTREPFITELERFELGDTNSGPMPGGTQALLLVFIGVGTLVLVLLMVVFLKEKKKLYHLEHEKDKDKLDELPDNPVYRENKTIKFAIPPPGTLKLLPGKLELISGDEPIKEIRFYKLPNVKEAALTFGRRSGNLFTHIQLKPMTVSIDQAKIVFKDGKHILYNYSKTNPSVVDGKPVLEGQSIELNTGSKIEMGEVVFEFFSN